MLCFFGPDFSFGQQQTFTLSPLFSYSPQHTGVPGGFNAGISAGVVLGGPFSLSTSLFVGSRTVAYDGLNQSSSLALSVSEYEAHLSAIIAGNPTGPSLSALVGGGIAVSSTEDLSLSAGGLGQVRIPARSDHRGFLASGISALLPISSRTAIVVEPSVRAYDVRFPLDFTLTGGLRVGLF
jgi:hypothetical protein